MNAPLRVGDVLYGFCGGYFGSDSYSDKRVEVIGADYVVARNTAGQPEFALVNPDHLTEYKENNE